MIYPVGDLAFLYVSHIAILVEYIEKLASLTMATIRIWFTDFLSTSIWRTKPLLWDFIAYELRKMTILGCSPYYHFGYRIRSIHIQFQLVKWKIALLYSKQIDKICIVGLYIRPNSRNWPYLESVQWNIVELFEMPPLY